MNFASQQKQVFSVSPHVVKSNTSKMKSSIKDWQKRFLTMFINAVGTWKKASALVIRIDVSQMSQDQTQRFVDVSVLHLDVL